MSRPEKSATDVTAITSAASESLSRIRRDSTLCLIAPQHRGTKRHGTVAEGAANGEKVQPWAS